MECVYELVANPKRRVLVRRGNFPALGYERNWQRNIDIIGVQSEV